jgi:hypothetical protein
MRALLPLALCCLLAVPAMAQRGGGGHGGGGFGGGGFRGGGMGGGMRGGGFGGGGFRGGFGFRGFGFNRFGFNRFGFNRFGVGAGFFGTPSWGWGGGWGIPWGAGWGSDTCWDYDSCYGGYGSAPGSGYGGYAAPAYSPSPGVTVISIPQSAPPAYVEHASPVTREYDEYGQEVHQSAGAAEGSSPVYLIAFTDHNIRAAQAYWVNGQVLHYVTLQHEERQIALSEVDRNLSLQLNRERHVSFQLP